jgi:mannose-6-phosphate isomerase-like protein (cupin superfamily)
MIYQKDMAMNFVKQGVNMWLYDTATDSREANVLCQETEKGHSEEFYHEKSTFIFYILEGSGVWVIEGKEYPVKATDVVMIPPGKRFYYKGKLKQLLVTTPAWEEKYERHVRDVEL